MEVHPNISKLRHAISRRKEFKDVFSWRVKNKYGIEYCVNSKHIFKNKSVSLTTVDCGSLYWRTITPRVNQYNNIEYFKFEEVLDFDFISPSARDLFIFNLDLFMNANPILAYELRDEFQIGC